MNDRTHDEAMIENFRKNPDLAISLLNSILNDGDDQGELGVLLRQMSAAFDKPDESKAAKDISNVAGAFRAMGLRLMVEPSQLLQRKMAHA